MSPRHMLFGGAQSPSSPSAVLGPHFGKSPLRGIGALTGGAMMRGRTAGYSHKPKPKRVLSSGPSIMQDDDTLIGGATMEHEDEKGDSASDGLNGAGNGTEH